MCIYVTNPAGVEYGFLNLIYYGKAKNFVNIIYHKNGLFIQPLRGWIIAPSGLLKLNPFGILRYVYLQKGNPEGIQHP